MSGPDRAARRHEAWRWIKAADEDVRAARLCLAGAEPAWASAAFHCHQAIEKLLKGFLVDRGVDFRKTRDLSELMASGAAISSWIDADFEDLRALTPWSIAYRYPSIEETADVPPSAEELEAALERVMALRSRLTEGWT